MAFGCVRIVRVTQGTEAMEGAGFVVKQLAALWNESQGDVVESQILGESWDLTLGPIWTVILHVGHYLLLWTLFLVCKRDQWRKVDPGSNSLCEVPAGSKCHHPFDWFSVQGVTKK